MKITVSSPIVESPRVMQVRGMFDLPSEKASSLAWDVTMPLEDKPWHIGLIVGPSGCGKTTIARQFWPQCTRQVQWDPGRSIVDAFPDTLSIKEVTAILAAVGLASPPAWLRPFHVLSTGQQFRAQLARLIAECEASKETRGPIVVDEFTSMVDRTAAQVGSAAIARTIRKRNLQLVAVTCHDDVEAWLTPDWVYRPAEQDFAWRLLRRRPPIHLDVLRCQASAWPLFAPHHYLDGTLGRNAVCFLALWKAAPVAFSAWLPFVGAGPPTRREHRTVTLPDFQGVGIGNALSMLIASMWKALGYRAISATTHPAMMAARSASPCWRMHRSPSFAGRGDSFRHALTRLTAGFVYVGPAMKLLQAKALLGGLSARD
jgi:hypothetical protein